MIKEMEPEILENKLNSEVITFLNEYSITTRYYNLDIITGRKYDFSNPIIYWAKIENDILNEYKVQIEENTSNRLIANYMNQFVDTFYFDNNLNEIDSMDYILNDLEKIEKVQKYSVLVFYKIIRKLVYLLIQDNMVNNLYPKYTEIFSAFCGNMEDEEIMAIDGWMDIIIK